LENLPGDKYCGCCGRDLRATTVPPRLDTSRPSSYTPKHLADQILTSRSAPEGERKQVTVLFSDLSGYTAMTEKLDPEEVKEIMARVFGEIAQIVTKYEGFIEKFIGDAVVALFGVPKAHEDDPVRAIRAAREMHEVVNTLSPGVEKRTGKPISMHTGVNTGLVVTGEVKLEGGTHGVAGDAINVASRLSSLASPGEILVGPETYRQAEGYFAFEKLEPATIKGKEEPIQTFRVLRPREEPITLHRLHGLRADLIGRKVEMSQLNEAVERLQEGKGAIISICGDAGTGKSRLIEEFKSTLDVETIQWREGHAYAYAQNIPYFLVIDLLNRAWSIEEDDPPETIRNKIESAIEDLIGKSEGIVPYVGSLYSLSYPEIGGVSPEFWKSRLQEAIRAILGALAQRAPTIICLEDIHWADPSSLDLLCFLSSEVTYPVLFLCAHRLPFSLFTSHQLSSLGNLYREIRLRDLSSGEAQDMMESLLKSKDIPLELRRFVQEKIEGNPFYLEEVINSLTESGALVRDDGFWRLIGPISELDIPPTVQGVIAARLDRLEKATKRILQEASVIGRSFLYEILKKITDLEDQMDRCLGVLERLDLIRARSLEPELEYVFKHALTQEVVYSGLLKKERQEIHERIAIMMEQLFSHRVSEFYETLAFHFKRGRSLSKAVDYLVRSGEKSLRRYAVEESHQYYQEAFNLLTQKGDKTKKQEELLIDLLILWSYVFYYRGDFKGLVNLLKAHEQLAESLDDQARLGMFTAWLGFALWNRERFQSADQYLRKALDLGEKIGDLRVIGYACTWLTWNCAELGLLEEAIKFGERAQEICKAIQADHYLYFKSLGGMGHAYWYKGEKKKAFEVGRVLLDYGQKHSNIRSLVMGHFITGHSRYVDGDFSSAIECYRKAIQLSRDPYYTEIPRLTLGMSYFSNGLYQEAKCALQQVLDYSGKLGCENLGTPAKAFLGFLSIVEGQMSQGAKAVEEAEIVWKENQSRQRLAITAYIWGKLYLQIAEGRGGGDFSTLVRNVGFLIRSVPFAAKKAEEHFNRAIEIAREIGAKGPLGRAYLDLGLLHRAKGKKDEARECIRLAIQVFEECEAEVFLKQAMEALQSLG
jgi:class 3 adenylate cyclase/tetratricopeptide (TPR) repeat protein